VNPQRDVQRGSRSVSTGLVVVFRALFLYLCLVWILLRLAADDAHGTSHLALVAGAVLIGFPVAAGVARLLHRRLPAGLAGGWRVSLAAVATALILPLGCLRTTGGAGPVESTVMSAGDHEIVPAALVQQLTRAGDVGGLRLRIRGLSVAGSLPDSGAVAEAPVMLLLETSLREKREGRLLQIDVRLIEESGERVLWRDEYSADPEDAPALRRVLIRALTDAMSRTRQGSAEGRMI
jgi:hypothetical protein